MLAVYAFFSDNKSNGYTLSQFKADWTVLSDEEKAWFKDEVAKL